MEKTFTKVIEMIILTKLSIDLLIYFCPSQPSAYQKNGYKESDIILTDYVLTDEESDIRQPILFPALAPHVERMRLNENCGFEEEYRVILNDTLFSIGFIKLRLYNSTIKFSLHRSPKSPLNPIVPI